MSEELMNDAKFSRLFIVMLIAMVTLAISLGVFASLAASNVNDKLKVQSDMENSAALAKRIAPVGQFAANATAAPVVQQEVKEQSPEEVYNQSCSVCHASGMAGAPIVGNKGEWAARIAQGTDTLYNHALNGLNGMPAKGGSAQLSDDTVKAVVDYMVEQSK